MDELPDLISALPKRYRGLLLQSKAGRPHDPAELAALVRTLSLEREARRCCTPQEWCTCRVIAAEVARMGCDRASTALHRLVTSAQARCFIARWVGWLRATERPANGVGESATCDARTCTSQPSAIAAGEHATWRHGRYLSYDTREYDFRGLLHRIFADVLPDATVPSERDGVNSDQASATGGVEAGSARLGGPAATPSRVPFDGQRDVLGQLHATAIGREEPGYASLEAVESGALLHYSKELDEATRYGCGSFHRIFKASPLLPDFLALFDRFVAEVVAPALGASSVVYQARPVFRVFLPHHLAVGPRHTDAAYHAQPNEINVWLPFTDTYESNSLQVESRAGAADFEPVACGYGAMYLFRGNECEHYTELNLTSASRVSMDFRVIRDAELVAHPVPEGGAVAAEPAEARTQLRRPAAPRPDGTASRRRGADEYFSLGRYYKQTAAASSRVPQSSPPSPARE